MINVSIDTAKAEAALDAMPAAVVAALDRKMRQITINLQGHVIRDKLSGQVLHPRSGRLRRSIQEAVHTNNAAVVGEVFSAGDVKYARIHEFGGTTPAHDIVPDKAQALAFMIGGKQVFAKVVHHPGSKMPERSFLRSALADQQASIVHDLRMAALQGMNERLAP